MITLDETSDYTTKLHVTDAMINSLKNTSPFIAIDVNGEIKSLKLSESQIDHAAKTKSLELKVDWNAKPQIQVVLN